MKSVPTFLRQQLKVKGKTQHNGRGMFEMTSTLDLSYDDIKSLINNKLQSWRDQGFIEDFESTDEHIVITFNELIFNPYYRRFHMSRSLFGFGIFGGVMFTIPNDREQALEDLLNTVH